MRCGMRPVHPGEILLEDYMKPLGLSVDSLASASGIQRWRLKGVIAGRQAITMDIAQRLAQRFGGEAQGWLNLQTRYEHQLASWPVPTR